METIGDIAKFLLLMFVFGGSCGVLGGIVGYIGARAIYERIIRYVEVEVDVQAVAARIVAPVVVDLQIQMPELAPLSVPVEAELVKVTPNVELAARMLERVPDLGPRGLAFIFDVSSATGQAYFDKAKKIPPAVAAGPLNLATTELRASEA